MALDPQTITVNLTGLSQKGDERQIEVGKLVRADNLEMLESGKLVRRRGYLRVNTARTMEDASLADHALFHRLGVYGQRLVVFAHDRILAVVDRTSLASTLGGGLTSGITDHGPVPRCSIAIQFVATASIYQVPDEGG